MAISKEFLVESECMSRDFCMKWHLNQMLLTTAGGTQQNELVRHPSKLVQSKASGILVNSGEFLGSSCEITRNSLMTSFLQSAGRHWKFTRSPLGTQESSQSWHVGQLDMSVVPPC